MNPLALSKYFDAWRLYITSQLPVVNESKVRQLARGRDLNEDHVLAIARLIQQRRKILYIINDQRSKELKSIYDACNTFPVHNPLDYIANPPIKKIIIVLENGKRITVTDKSILWNACHQGFKFLKSFFHSYIKKAYNPNAHGKGKAINLKTSNISLARQIIKYLESNSELQQKETGNFLIKLFSTVGNPLPYTDGKTAYDAIMR
jgi:hypothetical protein